LIAGHPDSLQLKQRKLSSLFSHFEQYAPVAPKIAVPELSRYSAASLFFSQITSDPTFFATSILLSQWTFVAAKSIPSAVFSLPNSWHSVCRSVFPSLAALSITASFATISHLTGNHSSPFTLVPGSCPVAQPVNFLALSACFFSWKTTSILSPGPGRRNWIFRPSVTFDLSSPCCSFYFTAT
jgi:hypothetical protein